MSNTSKPHFNNDTTMEPHEKIELIVTTVASIDGVKWQDVLHVVGKKNYLTRCAIAYLVKEHVGEELAKEVTGYGYFTLRKAVIRYHEYHYKYRGIENYINKLIEQNTDNGTAIQCRQGDGMVQGQAIQSHS